MHFLLSILTLSAVLLALSAPLADGNPNLAEPTWSYESSVLKIDVGPVVMRWERPGCGLVNTGTGTLNMAVTIRGIANLDVTGAARFLESINQI